MKTRKFIFAVAFAMLVAVLLLVSTRVGSASQGSNTHLMIAEQVEQQAGPTPTPCYTMPAKPTGLKPATGTLLSQQRVWLSWKEHRCSRVYKVTVRRDSVNGAKVLETYVNHPPLQSPVLLPGHAYYWQVEGCNNYPTCTKSDWNLFIIWF